jgi:hypothetical protein
VDISKLPIQHAEDLAKTSYEHNIEPTHLLGMTPPCHKTKGFYLGFSSGTDVMVLICEVCKRTCGGVKIARKTPLS